MTGKCVLLFLAIGAVVVIARRNGAVPAPAPAKAASFLPANFQAVPELQAPDSDPITEAAYHQAPTNFLPAFGSGITGGDSEVITLA